MVTVEQAKEQEPIARLYKGVAAFWQEGTGNDGPTAAKEICKDKTGFAFGKGVKNALDSGKRVTVWKDKEGTYHAEI